MKELDSTEIHQIAYNCRKATYLIEKKQIGKITIREKLELTTHLAGCSVCRIFEQQSITINRMVKEIFQAPGAQQLTLDNEFKGHLQNRIESALNKM